MISPDMMKEQQTYCNVAIFFEIFVPWSLQMQRMFGSEVQKQQKAIIIIFHSHAGQTREGLQWHECVYRSKAVMGLMCLQETCMIERVLRELIYEEDHTS